MAVLNHDWTVGVSANVRIPTGIKPNETFAFKFNQPKNANGYGSISSINVSSASAERTMVISECPGKMESVSPAGTYDACIVTGKEVSLKWSFNTTRPSGASQCRLDPNKEYYINIKHETQSGKNTCTTATCNFAYSYLMKSL